MQNWENRRSFIFNSFSFLIVFLCIYTLTSIAMGLVLSWATPIDAWVWIVICNAFMLIMVWTKFSEMKEGVGYVMKRLGAIEVNQFNQNPIVARYMQVVIEMSIAASISMPRLFVLPSYDINAFAIATNDKDTAIAVTEGAITRLTRSELQALVGHEISHILHKDPLLNFKLIGWLFGLQSVYLYGYSMFGFCTRHFFGDFDFVNRFCLGYSMRTVGSGRSEFGEGNELFVLLLMAILMPVILLSLLIMSVGAIGAIFARIVKALISRQREYLADSESVRFVRGKYIVRVLEKIAMLEGDEDDNKSTSLDAAHQEFSHFYLQNYQEKTSIFDTHPPILKRIRKIQPAYRLPSQSSVVILDKKYVDRQEADDAVLVTALHDYAISRRNNIGHNVAIALGLDQGSQLLFIKLAKCYAAFLAVHNELIRQQQLDYLKGKLSPQLQRLVGTEGYALEKLTDYQRLQVLSNELPNFNLLAKFQVKDIEQICQHLVFLDNKISIAEYCMLLIVRVHILKMRRGNSVEFSVKNDSINDLELPLAQLISVVTTVIFGVQSHSAERCYADIVEFLGINIQYQANLNWRDVLDESLPSIQTLSVRDQAKLEEVFSQLMQLPKLNSDGRCLLFILQRAFNFLY